MFVKRGLCCRMYHLFGNIKSLNKSIPRNKIINDKFEIEKGALKNAPIQLNLLIFIMIMLQ